MKKTCLLFTLCVHFLLRTYAQPDPSAMELYSGSIPNNKKVPDAERVETRATGGRFIYDTAIPTLTAYQPKYPNGTCVIICPGGGYIGTAIDKEGTLVAQSLTEDSITAFVLKYRIPNDAINIEKALAPLQDAQQAIRFVRQNATHYGVKPDKIGIMGFSAGGHLAATAATHFQFQADSAVTDPTSVRPDFVVLIYPVISFTPTLMHEGSRTHLLGEHPAAADIALWSADQQVTAQSPPAFLVHAGDDKSVPVGNSLTYYSACIKNGVAAEMHLYPKGGHGFGLFNGTTADFWMDRLKNWLKTL